MKIAWFVPYATFWKKSFGFSQIEIVIKYLVQLKFVYYHRSWNKNICQGVCKFAIISKRKISAYGTMVEILAILNIPWPKGTIWNKNLNLLLEVCICPNVLAINFLFHSLTCCFYLKICGNI